MTTYEARMAARAPNLEAFRLLIAEGVKAGAWTITKDLPAELDPADHWYRYVEAVTPHGSRITLGIDTSAGKVEAKLSPVEVEGIRKFASDVTRKVLPSPSVSVTRKPAVIVADLRRRFIDDPDVIEAGAALVASVRRDVDHRTDSNAMATHAHDVFGMNKAGSLRLMGERRNGSSCHEATASDYELGVSVSARGTRAEVTLSGLDYQDVAALAVWLKARKAIS